MWSGEFMRQKYLDNERVSVRVIHPLRQFLARVCGTAGYSRQSRLPGENSGEEIG